MPGNQDLTATVEAAWSAWKGRRPRSLDIHDVQTLEFGAGHVRHRVEAEIAIHWAPRPAFVTLFVDELADAPATDEAIHDISGPVDVCPDRKPLVHRHDETTVVWMNPPVADARHRQTAAIDPIASLALR